MRFKYLNEQKTRFVAGLFIVLQILISTMLMADEDWSITSPYAEVDWSEYGQYKANLHTHTTMSDGQISPTNMIDAYHEHDYAILALTDHDTLQTEETTWPWTDYGQDPEELGMLAVQGNEISRTHHIGSFFNNYGDGSQTSEEAVLREIGKQNGLAVMFHPGRYGKPIDWYVDLYEKHDHLVGIEVYNQGDRYPGDRDTWDKILTRTMPERPVWGYANDDAHTADHIGRNWQMFLLPELTKEALRHAMANGHFYFAHTQGRDDSAPLIKNIVVDNANRTISIEAESYDSISWISEGKAVGTGPVIEVAGINAYVRAVLEGKTGETYTQPFYVNASPSGASAANER